MTTTPTDRPIPAGGAPADHRPADSSPPGEATPGIAQPPSPNGHRSPAPPSHLITHERAEPVPAWKRYGVALAVAAIAVGLAALTDAYGAERGQVALSVVAVLAATSYGGPRAGFVASLASIIGLHLAIHARGEPLSVSAEELVSLAVLAVTTLIAGAIYERARAGQHRARALAEDLEEVAAALRVSETRWRQVAEAIPAMTNESTAGGAIVYFSRRWTDYTGLSPDELLSRWPDVVHPDDLPRVMAQRERAIPGGEPFSWQWRARGRDGGYRWFLGYSSPVKDGRGRVVSWLDTSVDIEEMKRGERLLRNQANLLDQTHDAVLVWDFDQGGIRYWNTAAETLYGYRSDEARGVRPHELLSSAYEQPFEIIEHVLESTGAWDGIIDQTSRDGRRIKVESRRVLVSEPDGARVVLEVNRDVTERVRADEVLRASERRWRELAEATPALIFEMAPDGRMLFFNQRAIDYTGRTLAELVGHGWLETLHPEDRAQWKADWEEARVSGSPITHEHRLRRHDGQYRWHLAYGLPMRDDAGEITSWLGIKVDIDERRRAEEELRASQEQFRGLVGAVPANVFLHAPDGQPLFANDRWLSYVGLTFEEAMVRDRYYDLVHPDDRQRLIDEWARASADAVPTRMEFRMRRHDGVYRWHLSDGLPLRDEAGNVTMWLTVSIDMDDQKRAHEEIRASEARMRESVARYEALIAAAPSYVFLTDASGVHTWSSPAYEEYVGEGGRSTAWKWLDEEVVHREDAGELSALWQSAIATGEPFEMEVRLRRADDEFLWHLQRVAPTRDEAGAITGWVGTSTDIDDRKRAQDVVRASELRLRAVVDTAVDAIITFDEGGIIESWNPAANRIFGYSASEAVGQSVRLLLPITEQPRRDAASSDALLGGAHEAGTPREIAGRRKDGATFPMDVAISGAVIGARRVFTALIRDVTERREAEDALRASEERFRLASAASRIGAWEWDLGTTVRWSENLEEIHGLAPGGFAGTFEAFMSHVHPDDRDLTMRAVNTALASGEELDFEYRIVLPDGTVRWLNGRGRLLRDAANQPLRMAGIGMDVTERKQAQSELALAEERLRLATEGAQFGMWDWHRRENRVYCSERELQLFGLEDDGEPLTSEGLMEAVHPDDREDVGVRLREAIERNATCELEFRVVHRDGSVHWLAGWAVAIADLQGSAARLIGLNADITQRKRQERDREFLADLGTALQQSLDLDVLAREIVSCTVSGFAQFCALYLREGDNVRRYASGVGADGVDVSTSRLGERESAQVTRALLKGRETLLPEIRQDDLHRAVANQEQEAMFRQIKLSSAIVVPLRAGGEITGALSLAASSGHAPFDEQDLETAREIAQRVTLALENARLYELAARDTTRQRTLADLASLLAESFDHTSTLRQAARMCVPALADWCAIDVLDDDGTPRRMAVAHADDAKLAVATELGNRWLAARPPDGEPHGVWYAIEHREPELVPQVSADLVAAAVDDERLRDLIKKLGVRSSLSIPLIARSRTLGAITFLMSDSGRNFEQADLPYFEEIGRRVALAVDSGTLYRAEREAQEALSERVAELETLLDNVPVGIAIAHDPACTRITANGEFNRILRSPAADVNVSKSAGRDGPTWFRILRDGDEVPAADLPMQRAAATGQPVLGEVLDIEFNDGSPSVREIGSALPLFGADGSVRGSIGVFMDITDRLRVEDELRRALAAKDDFLGMVSHELKTPITMVRGNAEILLRRGEQLDDETRRQSVSDILIDSERLQSIIENLLVLARLEHASELPSEPLFIARAVERFVEDYNRRIGTRQVLVTDRSHGAVSLAEPSYLEQVLRNLLSNAMKYSPAGEPIEMIVDSDARDIRVRVMDRGPGVPPDEAELIFTPFYRSARTSSHAHGVGVGLAVCRRMIEAQGGSMWCEPRDGGGTEFIFSLPRAADDIEA